MNWLLLSRCGRKEKGAGALAGRVQCCEKQLSFSHDSDPPCVASRPAGENQMEIANLVLPVFAVIVTGWLAGTLG
jgi:hypothetical protein